MRNIPPPKKFIFTDRNQFIIFQWRHPVQIQVEAKNGANWNKRRAWGLRRRFVGSLWMLFGSSYGNLPELSCPNSCSGDARWESRRWFVLGLRGQHQGDKGRSLWMLLWMFSGKFARVELGDGHSFLRRNFRRLRINTAGDNQVVAAHASPWQGGVGLAEGVLLKIDMFFANSGLWGEVWLLRGKQL